MEKVKITIKANNPITAIVKKKHTTIPNDYDRLKNKPTINGIEVIGQLTNADLKTLSALISDYQDTALNDNEARLVIFDGNGSVAVLPILEVLSKIDEIDGGKTITVEDDGSIEQIIKPNVFYNFTGEITELSISFDTAVEDRENEYKGQFVVGSTIPQVTFPTSVKWLGEEFPELEENKTYQFSVVNNIGVIIGV